MWRSCVRLLLVGGVLGCFGACGNGDGAGGPGDEGVAPGDAALGDAPGLPDGAGPDGGRDVTPDKVAPRDAPGEPDGPDVRPTDGPDGALPDVPDVPSPDVPPPDVPDIQTPDVPDVQTPDVPDVPGPDAAADADAGAPPPETVTVSGVVWRYSCMFCDVPDVLDGAYSMEPAGGVVVEVVGLAEPLRTTTSEDHCLDWWVPDVESTCGTFTLEVPRGAFVALRAEDPGEFPEPALSYYPTLGPLFLADDDGQQLLVLAQRHLASALLAAWGIPADPEAGLVAGITAVLDVAAELPFTELVGGAEVAFEPAVADPDYRLVYFDSEDPASAARTTTDPAQPLFFAANVPPRGADAPYHTSVTDDEYAFGSVPFAVAPGTLTYLPLSPIGPAGPVPVWGRAWSYFVSGGTLAYDYPWDEIRVAAYGAGAEPLAETTTNTWDCTPWEPEDPYLCGTFRLDLAAGARVMLKGFDAYEAKDTLTGIFTVTPDLPVRTLVLMDEGVVDLVSTAWGVPLDPTKGHVAVVVATPGGGGLGDPPYEEFIGDAVVTITPDDAFGEDTRLVYYDSANPLDTTRTATDPALAIFVALNVPPRPFAAPYTARVEHGLYAVAPVEFAVEPDGLTYLILSPGP